MSEATTAARVHDLAAEAQTAVARARTLGADDAAASLSEGRSTEYVLRDGALEKVQESVAKALTVELYAGGRYSAHTTNDLRPASLEAFLSDAVTLTRALQPDPYRKLPDPELYAGRSDADLDLVDESLAELDRDACSAALRSMDEACHADERVISATSALQHARGRSAHATSNGFEGAAEGTSLAWVSEVTVRDDDGRRPEAYAFASGRHREDLPPPEEAAARALARALSRLGSGKAPSGAATMVVDREAAAALLSRAFGALSAGAVQQRRSFLADRLDQPIASPLLTVRDEPLLVRGLGSRHFDGEGIAARPRAVIEGGVLRTYFVDTYYGRKLGWKPTTGSPSNLLLATGRKGLDELVADAGRGIYVTGWAGGNVDATTGDFSFGLRGHRIEDGAIGEPVGEMNVTGNYLELLGRLSAVGNDPLPWSSMRSPTLVFEGVQFSGS